MPDQTLILLDAACRSAAFSLMVLAALVLGRTRGQAGRLGMAMMLAGACSALDGMAGLHLPLFWAAICSIGAALTVPFFWLFSRTWFDDGFRPGRADYAVVGALGALNVYLQTQDPTRPVTHVLDVVVYAASTALAAHVQGLAWRGREGDLVEPRRRARVIFVVTVGLAIVWTLWSEAFTRIIGPSPGLGAVSGAVSALVALGINAMLLDLRHDGMFAIGLAAPPEAETSEPIDGELAQRLERLMTHERLYRSPDLTIGVLAARLSAPEYRLRRLINGGLGYRNFAEYLNARRLAEVREALADRDQAKVPILTIAMDAGFGSLVAFNRAFKAAQGQTPTDYRRRALAAKT